jgi:hypothetical protein
LRILVIKLHTTLWEFQYRLQSTRNWLFSVSLMYL